MPQYSPAANRYSETKYDESITEKRYERSVRLVYRYTAYRSSGRTPVPSPGCWVLKHANGKEISKGPLGCSPSQSLGPNSGAGWA